MKKKAKILLFQGSPRDLDTCPDMFPKTKKIIFYILNKWGDKFDFKVIDLSVNQNKKPIIQPCKGCISTGGGYHCHYKCSCYFKGDKEKPDLLKEYDVYDLLEECDAFIIFSPIHWYSLSSQIKALFDRLVCINQTLTIEDAIKIMGKENIKNSKITGELSKSGKYDHLLKNHLEGKYAGFYVHGDDGANDYHNKKLPKSYNDIKFDKFSLNPINVIQPYIFQLKYSGVFVPNDLIQVFYTNKNIDYYTANVTFNKNKEFFERADELMKNLYKYVYKQFIY